MKKLLKVSTMILLLIICFCTILYKTSPDNKINNIVKNKVKHPFKKIIIHDDYEKVDKNNNGIYDTLDLVNSARLESKNKTKYKSDYYIGGYPPEGVGVCTDVIWRAFKGADINLKDLVDKDIKKNTHSYYRVNGSPDGNIDFRRVPNLDVFFKKYAISLSTDITPYDIDNLKEWQPGDIVVILKPYEHIGIISDKRSNDGVPYIIHNSKPHASEVAHFNLWDCKIAGHYRWRFGND